MAASSRPGRTRRLKQALALICLAAIGAVVLFFLTPGQLVYIQQAPDRFVRIFEDRVDEYVFLLGVLLIFAVQVARKQWILATTSFLIGALWLTFSESLVFWLKGLGADSFSEAQDFDWSEAIFFIRTLPSLLAPIFPYRRLIIYVIIGCALLWSLGRAARALGISRERFLQAQLAAGFVIVAIPLVHIAVISLRSAVDNTALYTQAQANFEHPVQPITFDSRMKVVIYIGESTAAMNFGVYGYPRATTPQLLRLRAETPGLLFFENVLTTFTHTSQSLLETLSIGLDRKEDVLPVMSRQRVSLVDLLAESHVPTFLLSNQGETGTWNMASRIVFRKAERTYSINTGAAGNADYKIPRPYDLDFFAPRLDEILHKLPAGKPAAIFLHSYAGHGTNDGYLGALPPDFRSKVDDFLSNRSTVQIFGAVVNQPLVSQLTEGAEEYDSAMRYVDFSVSQIIAQVSKVEEPITYLYFSDHGESSFSASGHESSRFKLEMGIVPFVMYFNEAARKQYPDLLSKYRSLAANKAISTLAQVPATIIDLLGGTAQAEKEFPGLTGVIGDPSGAEPPPVLVRSTSSGDTFVSLSGQETITSPLAQGGKLTNAADDATRIYVARESRALGPTRLCYGRADTLASAMRGALAADCIGIAISQGKSGSFTTNLGAGLPPGPDLASILKITTARKSGLWIDASSAGLPGTCEALGRALADDGFAASRTVAFPSKAAAKDAEFSTCASQLRKLGLRVALQVPVQQLLACGAQTSSSDNVCKNLDAELRTAIDTGNYSDLAVEQRGEAGARKLTVLSALPLTLTDVAPRDLAKIKPGMFNTLVITPVDVNQAR